MDFETIAGLHLSQHLAHNGMLDFSDFPNVFQPRIRDPEPVLEKGRQLAHTDVRIFVDGGSQHGSAVFAKPRWVICAAAKQRNAEWGPADNHGCASGVRLTVLR